MGREILKAQLMAGILGNLKTAVTIEYVFAGIEKAIAKWPLPFTLIWIQSVNHVYCQAVFGKCFTTVTFFPSSVQQYL